MWIVWNEARTEGFITNDVQLAYEVRKSADTNCVMENGDPAPVAVAFCERWSQDNCTMEPIAPVNQVDAELALFNARGEMDRAYKRHGKELALLRAQLAARDAALDAVLSVIDHHIFEVVGPSGKIRLFSKYERKCAGLRY